MNDWTMHNAYENSNQDFFQVVPPTPQAQMHSVPIPLRSHRSTSSIGSIDSHISHLSRETWATSVSSDTTEERPSLSVDPRLFQRPVDDDLTTAKPKKARSPKKPAEEKKKKVSHARKQHPEHIPRPRNAFILYRKHVVDSKLIPPSVEMRHQNVSIITAKMWSEAPSEQKAHFNDLARIEKEEHMKKYPGYRYQPVYRRTNVIRRRVRKDEAEEEKCRSVAELLLKGKSGQDLEHEIKEKIKAPEPVKVKKPTRTASELFKGAIRALRAQARSTPSVDWSDVSESRAPSLEPEEQPLPQQTWAYDTQVYEPDFFSQPTYPTYSQPMQPMQPNYYPEYFAYDHALPFSPTQATFQYVQPMSHQHMSQMSLPLPPPINTTDNSVLLGASFPSPTSGWCAGSGNLALRLPISPRWDRTNHQLHNVVPSEGLVFEPNDMLHDFENALAQAEDMW